MNTEPVAETPFEFWSNVLTQIDFVLPPRA
jgi:hypothetical protein